MSRRGAKADSPCIAVCSYLPDSKVCRGCFRSIEEIWNWPRLADNARRDILRKTKKRKSDYLVGAKFSV